MQTKQILLYETLYLHKMVPSNFFLFILKISLIHFLLSDIGEMDYTGHIVFISRKGDQMINMTEIESIQNKSPILPRPTQIFWNLQ